MKKFLLPLFFFAVAPSIAQKKFSEGTIVFTVSTSMDGKKIAEDATGVQMTKGGHLRMEMNNYHLRYKGGERSHDEGVWVSENADSH